MSALPLSFVPVVLGVALHITGCAASLSPEARCFADATVEYRAAWRTAEALRADLDRGYALHAVPTRRVTTVPCREDGRRADCLYEVRETQHLPAPIDRAALEHRLAAYEAQMAALRPAAMASAAPCGYAPAAAAAPSTGAP